MVTPGEPGAGLRLFRAEDGSGGQVSSLMHSGSGRCTTVFTQSGLRAMTVEHAFAAFAATGLDDVDVWLLGDEMPILDGSAAPWVEKIVEAGTAPCEPGPTLEVVREFAFSCDAASYEASPCPRGFQATVAVDYPDPVGRQSWTLDGYASLLDAVPSRTFAFVSDVGEMARAGLAAGGSLDNALVIGNSGPLNPGGWRMANECAAHKAVDFVGDLMLASRRVRGRFSVHRPGHGPNGRFLAAMLRDGVLQPVPARGESPQSPNTFLATNAFRTSA